MQRKLKPWANKMLLLLISIIISFFVIESFLFFFYPQLTNKQLADMERKSFDSSEYIPYKLLPNAYEYHTNSLNNEFNVSIKINSLGYRDNEFKIKKINDTKRILIMGDSMTYGHGVEQQEVYTEVLENLLNNHTKIRWEVINGAYVSGFTTDTAYVYLNREGFNLEPDLIILGVYLGMDITEIRGNVWIDVDKKDLPTRIKSNIITVIDHQLRNKVSGSYRKPLLQKIDEFMGTYSQTYCLFRWKFPNVLNYISSLIRRMKTTLVYRKEYWENYADEWTKMKKMILEMNDLSKEKNISFYVLLLPSKEQVGDNSWNEYSSLVKCELNRELPQQMFLNFSRDNNINVINPLMDLRIESNKTKLFFEVDKHMNSKGHYVAANSLFEYLAKIQFK